MGLSVDHPVVVDTSNSKPALDRLFGGALLSGDYFVPFAKTPRFMTMKDDASRSIIQTTIKRWEDSGSVVTVDPTGFLTFTQIDDGVEVRLGRSYPSGLGHGPNGFAPEEGTSLAVPIGAWAAWYGRDTDLDDGDGLEELISEMAADLNLAPDERDLVFAHDDFRLSLQPVPLSSEAVDEICREAIGFRDEDILTILRREDNQHYNRRVRSLVPEIDKPSWLRTDARATLQQLLDAGALAILLYGPPRTGKTWMVDQVRPREDPDRTTIQLHEGWGYEHLVESLKPKPDGQWVWQDGPLLDAITAGKKLIVLEEANRTQLSQALGEIFSLLEAAYRGDEHRLILRSGKEISVPKETVFIFTMNTVDRSTEDIDDALMGRVASVECPPDPSVLRDILKSSNLADSTIEDLLDIYQDILAVYPLGHGYFVEMPANLDDAAAALFHYQTRIRPVLHVALGAARADDLTNIDNAYSEKFG